MRREFAIGVGVCLLATGCSPGGGTPDTSAELLRTQAAADVTDADCTSPQTLSTEQLLRRLSLDLRGTVPTVEEYEAVEGLESIPDSVVEEMVASEGFRLSMRRYHESLMWPNPEGVVLRNGDPLLIPSNTELDGVTQPLYAVIGNARQGVWRVDQRLTCGNWLQEEYVDGRPVPVVTLDEDTGAVVSRQEGYTYVRPYWAPDTEIAVCAFEAMEVAEGLQGANCATAAAFRDPGCGCGPDLRWCYGPDVQTEIHSDLREQFGRMVDNVTMGGAPYSDILLDKSIDMNGRLAFWKTHLAQMVGANRTVNFQGIGDPDVPPDIAYTDTSWQAYERTDIHSGVLTAAAWTLRFPTNRARANRFRIAFTGQYFLPPTQPEDPETADCLEVSSDLTQQCTCRGCHQALEPLAAHFANVVDAGSTLISDVPEYEQECDPGDPDDPRRVNQSCNRLYTVNPEAQNPGWRDTHQFAYQDTPGFNNEGIDDALHRAIYEHIQGGPAMMAQDIINDGQFARGTVSNLFKHLIGRDMNLDPGDSANELVLYESLAKAFASHGDFPTLVKDIVALEQYGRIR